MENQLKIYWENLVYICKWVAEQLKQDSDMVIVNDGNERRGKSSLSYWQGRLISHFVDVPFNVNNFVWSSQLVIDKMREMEPFSTVDYDEAGEGAYSRRATSSSNVSLNQAAMVCGLKNQCFILNIPDIGDLDGFFRDRRASLHFRVIADWAGSNIVRGMATVESNLEQPYYSNFKKRRRVWLPECEIVFPDMPRVFKRAYVERKTERTMALLDSLRGGKSVGSGVRKKDLVIDILKRRAANGMDSGKDRIKDTVLMNLLGVSRPVFYEAKREFKKI